MSFSKKHPKGLNVVETYADVGIFRQAKEFPSNYPGDVARPSYYFDKPIEFTTFVTP